MIRHSWIFSLLYILRCTHECMQLIIIMSWNYCTSVHAVWRHRIACHNVHNMLQQYGHVSECLQGGVTCKSYWLHSLKESGNRRKEGQSRSFSPVTTFFYAVKSVTFSQNVHACSTWEWAWRQRPSSLMKERALCSNASDVLIAIGTKWWLACSSIYLAIIIL